MCTGYLQTYNQAQPKLHVFKVAWDEIKKAGENERKLADIDIDSYFHKRKKF